LARTTYEHEPSFRRDSLICKDLIRSDSRHVGQILTGYLAEGFAIQALRGFVDDESDNTRRRVPSVSRAFIEGVGLRLLRGREIREYLSKFYLILRRVARLFEFHVLIRQHLLLEKRSHDSFEIRPFFLKEFHCGRKDVTRPDEYRISFT
jgi:hypothetical protein